MPKQRKPHTPDDFEKFLARLGLLIALLYVLFQGIPFAYDAWVYYTQTR